ncbi:helix-turn-helix domain-containing protein [Tardiphaga sp. vice278]|nr:helix-turn-helix domain-containing protein [Tardiphaga sp. vice278]
MTLQQAAHRAQKVENTIRNWCEREGLGRRIGGKWCVSKVALEMYLDGEGATLDRYLKGDRQSADVAAYFAKFMLPMEALVLTGH